MAFGTIPMANKITTEGVTSDIKMTKTMGATVQMIVEEITNHTVLNGSMPLKRTSNTIKGVSPSSTEMPSLLQRNLKLENEKVVVSTQYPEDKSECYEDNDRSQKKCKKLHGQKKLQFKETKKWLVKRKDNARNHLSRAYIRHRK